MRKIIIIITIIFEHYNGSGQNLVPNPSFENHSACPASSSEIYLAIPWEGVTTNSSDYYHVCGAAGVGVPYSGTNFQYPRTGDAHAGIYAINAFGFNYREYLQVELTSALVGDSCYLVEFYCNLNAFSMFCTNRMGAFLSTGAVSSVGPLPDGLVLQYTPQITATTFLQDTANWMHISGFYRASGGENFLTIGNFSEDHPSDTLHLPAGTYPGAYYFIDDVAVVKIPECDTLMLGIKKEPKINIAAIYPNPADQFAIVELNTSHHGEGTLLVFDTYGRQVRELQVAAGEKVVLIERDNLRSSIYFFHYTDASGVRAEGSVIFE